MILAFMRYFDGLLAFVVPANEDIACKISSASLSKDVSLYVHISPNAKVNFVIAQDHRVTAA